MDKPIVYLVGAGPGDAGLLTLRGKECLEQADLVIYDQLVAPRLLDYAPPGAEKVCVSELAPHHPDRWPHVNARLVEEARAGKCVVRLKGGDPLIFGRGGEEAEVLRAAGIPYEIVPGVTAALAAGSYLEIPLTHRSLASAVAFITGHEHPGKPASRIDWQAIATFPGTLVFYMGFARLGAIVAELVRHGKPADSPAAAVSHASTGGQRTVTSTLREIEERVKQAGLTTPALLLVGPVVGLKPEVSWSEARPLLGARVLVTRPRHQAGEMVQELERLGATPVLLPAVEIREPANWGPVDLAQEKLGRGEYHWLVFTSANGVEFFMRRLKERGRDLRQLGTVKLAAIGPKTAAALRAYHLEPDVAPGEEMDSERLVRDLRSRVVGQRLLVAQADRARDAVREQLSQVAHVDAVTIYRQIDAVDRNSEGFARLRDGEVDYVTLTSPAIARSFLAACDEPFLARIKAGSVHVVTNGPRISAAVRERGLPVAAESADPTAKVLIEALVKLREGEKAHLTHLTSR